jgi:ADP-heptose:LPS heptosyltransferase
MCSWHLSNWNQKRIVNFFTARFKDVVLYFQRMAAPGPDPLAMFEISAKPWPKDENEHFLVVAKGLQSERKKRLVIKRTGSLGQVIWTTPVVEQIKNNNPGKNLCVVTDKGEVFINNPYADVVVTEAWPGQVDIDLNLAEKPGEPVHVLEAYKRKAGLKQVTPQPRLFLSEAFTAFAKRIQAEAKRVIACHPLASPPERVWPEKNWLELIEKLKQEYSVVLVGDKKDFNVKASEVQSFLEEGLHLFTTAAIIARADLFVGPEASDLCDVAAAVQVPCVILLGAVPAQERLPQTDESIGISIPPGRKGAGMEAITVEMVIEVIKKRLANI